jgi:hypothetical protein
LIGAESLAVEQVVEPLSNFVCRITKLLRPSEPLLYLAVAIKTLNEWARLDKIPAYPWGDGCRKTWRFKLTELDVWMQRRIHSGRRPPRSEGSVRIEKEAH